MSYEYLGTGSQGLPSLPNLKTAVPLTVSYDSQYSNFTFSAGPVDVTASFLSSVIPKDICRTSIPLSYLTTTIISKDGAPHDVQFYSDVNAAWIAYETNKTIEWGLFEGSNPVNGSGNATGGPSSIYSWSVVSLLFTIKLAGPHSVLSYLSSSSVETHGIILVSTRFTKYIWNLLSTRL